MSASSCLLVFLVASWKTRRHGVAGATPQHPRRPSKVNGPLLSGFGRKGRAAALRYEIEQEDVERHRDKGWEDMQGQEVTVRIDGGIEVQGHISRIRFEDRAGSDTKGLPGRIRFEKTDSSHPEAEGHSFKRIELGVDGALGKLLRAASDKGEPVYLRFSDEDDIQGHV